MEVRRGSGLAFVAAGITDVSNITDARIAHRRPISTILLHPLTELANTFYNLPFSSKILDDSRRFLQMQDYRLDNLRRPLNNECQSHVGGTCTRPGHVLRSTHLNI